MLPRFDRLLTLYLSQPLIRILPSIKQGRIPILMYHNISAIDESSVHPYFRIATSPEVFASQMKYLYDNGYTVIGLNEAGSILSDEQPTANRYVAITFDDGYRDFYTNAFPILNKYGFTATMFLPTSFIADQNLKFNGTECLSWGEVRELHSQGITFGSHTATHPVLKNLKNERIEYEILESKKMLDDELGIETTTFSYPYAFPESNKALTGFLKEALLKSGYKYGVSTVLGTASAVSDPLFFPRLPVNNLDDSALLKAKLEGAYNWLHTIQRFYKRMKQGINAK